MRLANFNSQILAQHDGDYSASRYFYLHDRLGSVRQIIDYWGNVKNCYTYNPFGELYDTETEENIANPFKFTGQYFDSEIDEYYLRARQYNPHIARFTTRDPVFDKFREPLTLHQYLYCINDPINRIDPSGEEWNFSSLAKNIFFRSIMAGVVNSAISGTRAYVLDGDPWKAAAGGFVGGFAGGLASLSGSGYIAAAVAGGLGSGFESALKAEGITKAAFLRVLTDTIAGGIAGAANHGFGNLMADKFFSGAPLWVQSELGPDAKKIVSIWQSFSGGVGGNIWQMISAGLGDWGHEND